MRNKKIDPLNPNYPTPNGHHPHRRFKLAPHHYLVGEATLGLIPDPGEGQFRILRGPDGRKVARKHWDLKEGEVSYVLE